MVLFSIAPADLFREEGFAVGTEGVGSAINAGTWREVEGCGISGTAYGTGPRAAFNGRTLQSFVFNPSKI